MTGFKFQFSFCVIIIFLSAHVNKKNKMELNEIVKNKEQINSFIEKCFEPTSSSYESVIYPFRFNYASKGDSITFCNLNVISSWALMKDSCYTFFLIIKEQSGLIDIISKHYGKHKIESSVEVNSSYFPTSYFWDVGKINIYLRKFRAIKKADKYENCSFVIIGNMNYKDIIILPGSASDW
jgi:hypothetical protein